MIAKKKIYMQPTIGVEWFSPRLMEGMTVAASGENQENAMAPKRRTSVF